MFMMHTRKEIANALNIGERTVTFHAQSIYRKAGIDGDESDKLHRLLRKFGRFEITVRWVPKVAAL